MTCPQFTPRMGRGGPHVSICVEIIGAQATIFVDPYSVLPKDTNEFVLKAGREGDFKTYWDCSTQGNVIARDQQGVFDVDLDSMLRQQGSDKLHLCVVVAPDDHAMATVNVSEPITIVKVPLAQ